MNRLNTYSDVFTGNDRTKPLIKEAESLITEMNTNRTEMNTNSSSSTNQSQISRIQQIAKELSALNESWTSRYQNNLNEDIVKFEFEAKKIDSSYKFQSKVAKDTYNKALKIFDGSDANDNVLSNPEDFYFFTNNQQIRAHEANWGNVLKVKNKEGKITFQDSQNTPVAKIRENEKDYVIAYDGPKLLNQKDNATGRLVIQPVIQRSKGSTYTNNDGEEVEFERDSYYVSLVTSTPTDHLSLVGHHSWLRLTDGDGKVYSVGKWPAKDPVRFAANMDPMFYAPDDHEWTDPKEKIFEKVIKITRDEFDLLKESIETDINGTDQKENTYNTLIQNCSDWALDTLEKNGVIVELNDKQKSELKINVFRVILPDRVNFLTDEIKGDDKFKLLRVALRIVSLPFELIFRPIATLFLLALGATVKRECDSTCVIKGIKDLFLGKIFDVTHPLFLRRYAEKNFPDESPGLKAKKAESNQDQNEFGQGSHEELLIGKQKRTFAPKEDTYKHITLFMNYIANNLPIVVGAHTA